MKKLNNFDLEMLAVIASYYPYSMHEISKIYKRTNSFDDTIKILVIAKSGCFSIDNLTEFFES